MKTFNLQTKNDILRKKLNQELKSRLANENFTVISSNCNGSIMLHDLGLPYTSPFVNLYVRPPYFIKYLKNIEYYQGLQLHFEENTGKHYPIAWLDDVEIHFLHYTTNEEAAAKWYDRTKRMNLNNLFIMMSERDGCTYEDLQNFDALPIKNKVMFTHRPYPEFESAFYIPGFEKNKGVGVLLEYRADTGHRHYDHFDYVAWFNGESVVNLNKKIENLNMNSFNKLLNFNPVNKIEKISVENATFFIEGLMYIEGYNSPNYTYLHKYLRLNSLQTNQVLEYGLGTVPRKELSTQKYQGKEYDYTAAGTATYQFKGIDISELPNEVYEITISVSHEINRRNYRTLNLEYFADRHSADDQSEYRIFHKHGKTYLAKREIIGREVPPGSHIALTTDWVKQTVFHVEGEFIVPGVDITEFNQAKYYLIAQKPITQRQYVFELGQIKKPNLGEKIGNPFGGYDACYFATLGLKGIDTAHFELGSYDLYVSLAYKSEIFTAKLDKRLEVAQGGVRSLVNN